MNLCDANIITAAENLKEKKCGTDAATERLVEAMERYAEMGTGYRVSDATESALRKIALKNWSAKSDLREILRKSPNWNEELQEVTAEIVVEIPADWESIRCEIRSYITKESDSIIAECRAREAVAAVCQAETRHLWAYKAYEDCTGHKLSATRKPTRIIRDILVACGAWDDAPGSQCQKQYAAWTAAIAGQTEKRKIHLSIDPAVQLTQSNPHEDVRGATLVSCHSLDNGTYGYSAGNSGYAVDTCTMILYTCAEGDRYTRKTSRQLYMYSNGTLLQSRLYDTNGANDRADYISKAYRQAVQAIIADCLGVQNDWTAPEKSTDADYAIETDSGFGGYPDYDYSWTGCTISHLTAQEDYSVLHIGAPGICISCGCMLCDDCGAVCPSCDTERARCAYCGERIAISEAYETVDGEYLCEYCATHHDYAACDCCGRLTRYYYYIFGTRETLCEDCFTDGDYAACDYCGDWYDADDLEAVQVYGCRRHADGQTLYVCDCCRGDLDAGGHLTAPEAEED